MARRALVFLLVLILSGGFVSTSTVAAVEAEKSKASQEDYYELYKVLVDTMDQVERNYVKEVDRRELIEAAIEGVLGKLDPYSTYINPEDMGSFRSNVESEFGGIGIQISVTPAGELKVLSPLVGTPAYRAGMLAGDRIVEIEGETTEDTTLEEAVRRLKGEEGTKVKLVVIHLGSSERVEVEITREIIHVDTVMGNSRKSDDTWDFMLEPKQSIGYVRVQAFSRGTAKEIRRALEELKSGNFRGLILDLRFNPGGLLSSAIEVSDLFIADGRIVSTKGRGTPERIWNARKPGTHKGFPMVVLVNRYSASASEIVSACLQDHKRAVVMGERTWGKGSVQNVIELEDGRSALKLTTASYRRPSGKNIDRLSAAKDKDEWGVTPDEGYQLRLSDSEMRRMVEDRRQRDVLRPHTDKPAEKPAEKPAKEPAEKPAEEPAEKPAEEPADKAEDDPAEGDSSAEPEDASEDADAKPNLLQDPPFVDRQLKMAVDYLTGELARAD